jgi:hypothetical protein|tara:strand:+ start:765 stop:1100 length:336 start_codon:yes stop_codon:yes gene_type:complete
MGYRSTMVLGVPKEKQNDLLELDLGNSADKFADIFEQEKIEDDIVIYRGEYLKWYDEFKDVQAIEEFLNKTWKEFPETTFLIGLGEDGTAHSEIGAYYNYCGIYSSIEVNK